MVIVISLSYMIMITVKLYLADVYLHHLPDSAGIIGVVRGVAVLGARISADTAVVTGRRTIAIGDRISPSGLVYTGTSWGSIDHFIIMNYTIHAG